MDLTYVALMMLFCTIVVSVSVVTFLFIGILVISEIHYYASTQLKFDYEVDPEVDGYVLHY